MPSQATIKLEPGEAAWLNWRLLVSAKDHPTGMAIREQLVREYPYLPKLPPSFAA